ncbi:MAG: DUF4340 domain-containing protein [Candidatus Pacebacteria bacterium]|nr:DUF4340 domain-containing protein [Candidatus Paceibacterota bacterium]
MTWKSIKCLGLILLFLLLILLGRQQWSRRLEKGEVLDYQQRIKGFTAGEILEIEIQSNDESGLVIKKTNNGWRLNDKAADQQKIQDLLESLLAPDRVELVAKTDLKHEDFGISEDSALKVILKQKDNLVFLIGQSQFQGSYLRFQGQPEVFLLPRVSSAIVSGEINDWYDKTVIDLAEKKPQLIKFVGSQSFEIDFKDEVWRLADGREVASEKVENLIASLSPLVATSLANEETGKDFPAKPSQTLTISQDQEFISLVFYQGETEFLIRKEPGGEGFLVPVWQGESLIKQKEDFLK